MHLKILETLPLDQLRAQWADAWGKVPHKRMGRTMLVKSLTYKMWEVETGGIPDHLQRRLDDLVRQHKRKGGAKSNQRSLRIGTELVRTYQSKKHVVKVTDRGLEYNDEVWSSLSAIATHIAGGARNGWRFFGVK